MNLRQAKLLARLTNAEEQTERARMALDGHRFQEWRIKARLDENRVTTRDARFALVGPERYAEAGGRTETDLFGRWSRCSWTRPSSPISGPSEPREIALALEAEGLAVHVTAGDLPELPDDPETLGSVRPTRPLPP